MREYRGYTIIMERDKVRVCKSDKFVMYCDTVIEAKNEIDKMFI